MRRSATTTATRPGHRPSTSGSTGDFGFLREGSIRGRTSIDQERPESSQSVARRRRDGNTSILDLSTKFESEEPDENATVESELRRELREAEREIERLNSVSAALQTELAARPPLAKVLALEKEHSQLELLYHSTQRENQLCMAEIEKGKRKERIYELEFAKHFGDNWMEDLNLASQLNPTNIGGPQSSPVMSTRTPISQPRRPSVVTRGLSSSTSHRASASTHTLDNSSRPASPQTSLASALPSSILTGGTKLSLPDHLEQIRALILGMDQKLKMQDEKLQSMAAAAKNEEKKYEKLVASSNATLAALSSSS